MRRHHFARLYIIHVTCAREIDRGQGFPAESCAWSDLGKDAKRSGSKITAAIRRKLIKYQGTFPATYCLLSLAVSISKTLGSDTQDLIKAMVVKHVDLQDDMPIGPTRAKAED